MIPGSPKPAASRPPRLWSAIITIIIIGGLQFAWDRATTGTTIIITIITIITTAGIDTKHIGHPIRMPNIDPPRASFDARKF
jgi:hypothetical protein